MAEIVTPGGSVVTVEAPPQNEAAIAYRAALAAGFSDKEANLIGREAGLAAFKASGAPSFVIDGYMADIAADIAKDPAVAISAGLDPTAYGVAAPSLPPPPAAPKAGTQPAATVQPTGFPAAATSPALNVPYGADYLNPTLTLLGNLIATAAQNERAQLDRTLVAAKQVADLDANPYTAVQAAAMRAGLGLPTQGGTQDVRALIASATRGGGVTDQLNSNGIMSEVPRVLSGAQLTALQGNPTGQGVVESFAKALGNPDIIKRSLAAAFPTGYTDAANGVIG